ALNLLDSATATYVVCNFDAAPLLPLKILATHIIYLFKPVCMQQVALLDRKYGGAGSSAKRWVSSPQVDTTCRPGTEKGALCPGWAKKSTQYSGTKPSRTKIVVSRRIGNSLVNQE